MSRSARVLHLHGDGGVGVRVERDALPQRGGVGRELLDGDVPHGVRRGPTPLREHDAVRGPVRAEGAFEAIPDHSPSRSLALSLQLAGYGLGAARLAILRTCRSAPLVRRAGQVLGRRRELRGVGERYVVDDAAERLAGEQVNVLGEHREHAPHEEPRDPRERYAGRDRADLEQFIGRRAAELASPAEQLAVDIDDE